MPQLKSKEFREIDQKVSSTLQIYQSALNLKSHEGDLVWSRFTGYVPAHAIFFAVIGQAIFSKTPEGIKLVIILFLSILGLILGFLWLISTIRGFEAVEYWSLSAIQLAFQLEKKYKFLNIFKYGYDYFFAKRFVSFDVGQNKPVQIRRSCLTRLFSKLNTRLTAYLSIGLIMLAYTFIIYFVLSCRQMLRCP